MERESIAQIKQGKQSDSLIARLWRQRGLQAMALPGVFWMIVFNFIPMYFIIISFQRYIPTKGVLGSKWVGFDNFLEFFRDERFWIVIRNTLGLNFFRLLICFPAGIIFAILLNEVRSLRFKRVVQTISYLPHFLSWIIVGGIMFNWMSESGILTQMFVSLGFMPEAKNMLGTTNGFWPILVSAELWKELGWSAIIYIAAITGIDQSLYEAASIDGAGRFRRIWNITLPSIKGTISVLLVLNISNLLGSNFDQLFVFMKPVLYDAVDVIDIYAYRMGIGSGRLSYATAIGFLRSVFAFMLLYGANRASRKLTETSLY